MDEIKSPTNGTVKSWRRTENKRNCFVKEGEKVVSIVESDGKEIFILVQRSGSIKSIFAENGTNVTTNTILAVVEVCKHPAYFSSLCVSCGDKLKDASSNKKSDNTSVPIILNGGQHLQLSKNEAERVQMSKISCLKNNRKLALILDLDHTLLHATAIPGPPLKEDLIRHSLHHLVIHEEITSGERYRRENDSMSKLKMESASASVVLRHHLIKLRPNLQEFLQEADKKYQLTIYTAGTRKYAEGVAGLIDPHGGLFQDRIVSRSDAPKNKENDFNPTHIEKSLSKIFLSDQSMAVIVDDREDVWRGGQDRQLLLVKPFEFFKNCVEANHAPGGRASACLPVILLAAPHLGALAPPPPPQDPLLRCYPIHEDSILDDQLLRCNQLLDDIHSRYYKSVQPTTDPSASVADILSSMRADVLRGCVVTFSGVIPTNAPSPLTHPLCRLALSLGAEVSLHLTAATTHLIAYTSTTSKVIQAVSWGVWVLHPDWLVFSRWMLARAREDSFRVVASAVDAMPISSKRKRLELEEHESSSNAGFGKLGGQESKQEEQRREVLEINVEEEKEKDDESEEEEEEDCFAGIDDAVLLNR